MKKCVMTDEELMKAVKEQGYMPVKVKRWRDGDVYVEIRPVSHKKLGEISDWASENLGVLICQPC